MLLPYYLWEMNPQIPLHFAKLSGIQIITKLYLIVRKLMYTRCDPHGSVTVAASYACARIFSRSNVRHFQRV
jgi:hypothetical protein